MNITKAQSKKKQLKVKVLIEGTWFFGEIKSSNHHYVQVLLDGESTPKPFKYYNLYAA